MLLASAIGIFAGSALPWAVILGNSLWGSPGALTWTLWAGLMTLAAAAVRWPWIVVLSAAVGGGIAVFFALWQTVRIFDRCPLTLDCLPGPGLGFLLVGGGAALYQVLGLVTGRSLRA